METFSGNILRVMETLFPGNILETFGNMKPLNYMTILDIHQIDDGNIF